MEKQCEVRWETRGDTLGRWATHLIQGCKAHVLWREVAAVEDVLLQRGNTQGREFVSAQLAIITVTTKAEGLTPRAVTWSFSACSISVTTSVS